MTTPELLARLRQEVEDERQGAIEELARYGAEPYGDKVDRPAGIDANFADSASASAERAEMLAFVEKARDRLRAADAALARMDEGSYGDCAVCGSAIPEARLEARPLSIRCVGCAA